MISRTGLLLLGGLLVSLTLPLQAQSTSLGIYTCTDAKGRKLTSDRPIAECADREQRVLNPSGTVRTFVGPSLTGAERAALEAQKRREAEEKAQEAEERRRERALLIRYPNRAVHDKERAAALSQIDDVRQAALARIQELQRQRKQLNTELEFYAKDPSKTPASLRRLIADTERDLVTQERFIAEQDAEKQRINARFDEQLQRLQSLWAQLASPAN